MPRRNRNANSTPISRDVLADQITHLARELAAPVRARAARPTRPPKATTAPCARA